MEIWLRRKYERKPLNIPVVVDAGNHGKHKSVMLASKDISPCGGSVSTRQPMPVGTNVIVRMILPSSRSCQQQGVVWRHTGTGMVVKFDKDSPNILTEFSYNRYLASY